MFDPEDINIGEKDVEVNPLEEELKNEQKKNKALSVENSRLKKEIEKIPDFDFRGKRLLIRSGNYKFMIFPIRQFFIVLLWIAIISVAVFFIYYTTNHTEQTGFDKGENSTIGHIYTQCFYLPKKSCYDTTWDSTMCVIPGNETCYIVKAVRKQ